MAQIDAINLNYPGQSHTGTGPWSVAVGDFNGDGKSDLVTADQTANTASVLLGNGNGTFQAKQSFNIDCSARPVAVGDFNGDGKSDLVAGVFDTSIDAYAASVLLGNGNGTFQAKHNFGTGASPYSVTVSDFNGDGKGDLVTADYDDSTASVLLGNGNGTFQAKQSFETWACPRSVAVGDLNSDGRSDLVAPNYWGDNVSVLLGNGTTATSTTTAPGLQPITGVSLATQADALSAQGQIDGYLDNVNKVSGTIGSALSRFQIAAQVASSVADVSTAAEAHHRRRRGRRLGRSRQEPNPPAGGNSDPRTGKPTARLGPHSAARVIHRPKTEYRRKQRRARLQASTVMRKSSMGGVKNTSLFLIERITSRSLEKPPTRSCPATGGDCRSAVGRAEVGATARRKTPGDETGGDRSPHRFCFENGLSPVLSMCTGDYTVARRRRCSHCVATPLSNPSFRCSDGRLPS